MEKESSAGVTGGCLRRTPSLFRMNVPIRAILMSSEINREVSEWYVPVNSLSAILLRVTIQSQTDLQSGTTPKDVRKDSKQDRVGNRLLNYYTEWFSSGIRE